MKKYAILLALIMTGCGQEKAPINLDPVVLNGSFENDFKNWSGWATYGGVDMKGGFDSNVSHAGKYSFRIISEGLKYIPNGFGTFSQQLSVKPNTKYVVKYWVKSNIGMITVTTDPAWVHLGYSDGNARDWHECQYEFTSPVKDIELRFFQDRTCDLWIDDVTIEEVK